MAKVLEFRFLQDDEMGGLQVWRLTGSVSYQTQSTFSAVWGRLHVVRTVWGGEGGRDPQGESTPVPRRAGPGSRAAVGRAHRNSELAKWPWCLSPLDAEDAPQAMCSDRPLLAAFSWGW